jgi:hypothetical protein
MNIAEVHQRLGEVIINVLLGNREISIRHDTDEKEFTITLRAFNKAQNIITKHDYKVADREARHGDIALIIERLNEKINHKS